MQINEDQSEITDNAGFVFVEMLAANVRWK